MNLIISKFTTFIQWLWTKVSPNWQVEKNTKWSISRIYKELLQINKKETGTPAKTWAIDKKFIIQETSKDN